MADDPQKPERTTSAAKEHVPDALSRARSLKQEFDHAKSAADKSLEHQSPDKAKVQHAPAPQQHLRPSGPTRKAVDRDVFNDQQAKERTRAQALYKDLQIRSKQQKMLDLDKDKDNEK